MIRRHPLKGKQHAVLELYVDEVPEILTPDDLPRGIADAIEEAEADRREWDEAARDE